MINLSNESVKQEIDPIKNNFKQTKFHGNGTSDQRNQKIRHVLTNNVDYAHGKCVSGFFYDIDMYFSIAK